MAIMIKSEISIQKSVGSVQLELKAPIVLRGGTSGTAKTYFVELIKAGIDTGQLQNIIVLDHTNTEVFRNKLSSSKNNLVIVDNADTILFDNGIYNAKYFDNDSSNQYLIFIHQQGTYKSKQAKTGEFVRGKDGIIRIQYDDF